MSGTPADRSDGPHAGRVAGRTSVDPAAADVPGNVDLPLAHALGAPALAAVRTIGRIAAALATPVYFVGGVPRNLILGREIGADLDIVAVGDAVALARAVRAAAGGAMKLHPRFGTATWRTEGVYIDLVTARSERYARPAALPDVAPGSLDDDLARRDFTVNTLALEIVGDGFGPLIDRHGGLRDLKDGAVRVLHAASFIDDPTRIFRAVRTEVRFDLTMEPATEGWARAAVAGITALSGARVLAELRQLFAGENADRAIRRLGDLGALNFLGPWPLTAASVPTVAMARPAAHGAVDDPDGGPTNRAAMREGDARLLVWLAANGPAGVRCSERLGLKAAARRDVATAVALAGAPTLSSAATATSAAYAVIARHRPSPLALAIAAAVAGGAVERGRLEAYAAVWHDRPMPLDGDDVIALGVPAGRAVGETLHALRAAWWDGAIADREAAIRFVRRHRGGTPGTDGEAADRTGAML
jgi:tRNA nucleotidyltransferase (CCA-adding enzyme)